MVNDRPDRSIGGGFCKATHRSGSQWQILNKKKNVFLRANYVGLWFKLLICNLLDSHNGRTVLPTTCTQAANNMGPIWIQNYGAVIEGNQN